MAGRIGPLRRRIAPVSRSPNAKGQLLEVGLWFATGACAIFLLAPAGIRLFEEQRILASEEIRTQVLVNQVRQAETRVEWLIKDPLADKRLLETEGAPPRKNP